LRVKPGNAGSRRSDQPAGVGDAALVIIRVAERVSIMVSRFK